MIDERAIMVDCRRVLTSAVFLFSAALLLTTGASSSAASGSSGEAWQIPGSPVHLGRVYSDYRVRTQDLVNQHRASIYSIDGADFATASARTVKSAPVRAAGCGGGAIQAERTAAVAVAANEVNQEGIRRFSELEDTGGVQDVVVSPFASWYLNLFTDAAWKTVQTSADSDLLRTVVSDLTMSASVWPDNGISFSERDARLARDSLCATTTWPPWNFGTSPSAARFMGPYAYAFTVLFSLSGEFEFAGDLNGVSPFPSYNKGGIRGARFDSKGGRLALFIFWGKAGDIEGFRTSLTGHAWESMVGDFRQGNIRINGIPFDRKSSTEVLSNSAHAFGTLVSPGMTLQHALEFSQALSVDSRTLRFDIEGELHGYWDDSQVRKSGGVRVRTYSVHSGTAVDVPSVPYARRSSDVPPLVYAVVDLQTGTILLIGAHE